MKIKVTNRVSAVKFSHSFPGIPSAMISISSNWDNYPSIKISSGNVEKVLFLQFDDVETDTGISREDAEKIADFVKQIKNRYDLLVVHCDAGISRSAGVAAAIMKYLTNDDMPIFNSPFYDPNMRCYRYVLEALMN